MLWRLLPKRMSQRTIHFGILRRQVRRTMTTAMVRILSMWTVLAALKARILWTGRMQVRMMAMGMIRTRIKMMAVTMKTMP